MTDLDVVVAKLHNIETVQKHQSEDIKEMSKSFTILAAQSEQINNIQTQQNALWKKYDSLTNSSSVLEKMREHQKDCPKDEMHRTFNWMWAVIGVHSVVLIALITAIINMSMKG